MGPKFWGKNSQSTTEVTLTSHQQESPPAWMQEAYCPPCSKYSLCCPILAEPPSPIGWTWPPPTSWTWPPHWLDLTPPPPAGWTWPPPGGPDPPWLDLTWPRLPPQLDLTPPPQLSRLTDPPLWQTDRHVSKHNLPVVLRTRVVMT